MARQPRFIASEPEIPHITWHGFHSLEERETWIREAAYYRYLEHGCGDGHDVEDWLAAEAEIDHGAPVSAEALPEQQAQQSSVRGPASDDRLKRAVKRKPRRAIPQIESVEPAEAPDRQ